MRLKINLLIILFTLGFLFIASPSWAGDIFPYGALNIDQGAVRTANNLVDLTIYATEGEYPVTGMRFSNDGTTWSAWEDYLETKQGWDITDEDYGGTLADGIKTVYVKLQDQNGAISEIFSDSIEYDTTPPITTADPAAGVFSYLRVVSLKTNEDDCLIYYTLDGSQPTTESDIYSVPIALRTKRIIKFFAVDDLGNTEETKTQEYQFMRIVTMPATAAPAHLREFDLNGKVEDTELSGVLYAFNNSSFRGGANIATGDVDGDGQDEIIVGVGSKFGPMVEIYDKDGYKKEVSFSAYSQNYQGGVDLAAGDLDGDGVAEIVTVNTSVTETDRDVARVKVYKYNQAHTLLVEFNAFGSAIAGGRVTLGDIDKDGDLEIIVAANRHGGPIVRAFEADGSVRPTQFFTFHPDYRGGIDLAAGDINGDGKDEIAVVPLANELSRVKIYRWRDDQYIEGEFVAFDDWPVGGNLEMRDIDQDGKAEIIVGTQSGPPLVKAFKADGTLIANINFYAYAEEYLIGVSPAILEF